MEMRKRKWLVVVFGTCVVMCTGRYTCLVSCCATRLQQMMENRQESAGLKLKWIPTNYSSPLI